MFIGSNLLFCSIFTTLVSSIFTTLVSNIFTTRVISIFTTQVQMKELDAKAQGTGSGIDAFNTLSKFIMEKHKETVGNEICKQIQKAIDWQLNKVLMNTP